MPAPPRSLNGARVLVVHENGAARMLLGKTLRAWSARPTEVASLAEALSAATGPKYDALIIDECLIAESMSLWQEVRGRLGTSLRTIRLLSFVTLSSSSAAADPLLDTELTKPIRLAELHRALTGCSNDSTPLTERTVALKKPAGMLPALHGRVLVVEDQPLNREVAIGMLASMGLEVETAHHGQQALDIIQSRSFDAVLMDCEMPVMDGFSATRALRAREQAGVHIPIIALTADVTSAGRAACLAAGMDDHLAKPFRREALHGILARWLGQRHFKPPMAPTATPGPSVGAPLLDGATLDALRALPRSGPKDMLAHIGELYLLDSRRLIATIEESLESANGPELARAAHAWRSYNGNVGANALAQLCRELEEAARAAKIAGAMLKEAGFAVHSVASGDAAVAACALRMPDIALLDVEMAEGDGYQACSNIRLLPGGADLPIVMVTGCDDTASIDQAYEAGATDFIVKPINWALLTHRIRYVMRGARTIEALRFSEQKNAALLRAIPDGIFLVDSEGTIGHCFSPIEGLSNIAGRESESHSLFDLLPLANRGHAMDCLSATLRGEPAAFEFSLEGKTLPLRHFECRYLPNSGGQVLAIIRDITARKETDARIHRLAYFDALTGLPNREWIREYVAQVLSEARRRHRHVALLYIDLDQFKRVNDTLGHGTGDALLCQVAGRLQGAIDQIGIDGVQGQIARLGGDEFMIVLTGLRDAMHAEQAAERMLTE